MKQGDKTSDTPARRSGEINIGWIRTYPDIVGIPNTIESFS